jgi:hypothetical protein
VAAALLVGLNTHKFGTGLNMTDGNTKRRKRKKKIRDGIQGTNRL